MEDEYEVEGEEETPSDKEILPEESDSAAETE